MKSLRTVRTIFPAVFVCLALHFATAQTTIDGVISNAITGFAVTNPTISFWLNNKTNWIPAQDDPSDGWIIEHALGNASGSYARTFNPSPTNLEMGVLAIGFQRAQARLDPPEPVPSQTTNFGLSPGTLRIELETDSDVTCQEHGYGGRPQINSDPGASNGRYLTIAHWWTHMRTPIYFPKAAEYNFTLRYALEGSASIYLLPSGWFPPLRTWPASGGAWTTVTQTILIDSAGWSNNFAIRGQNMLYNLHDYVDYLEIAQGDPLTAATVSGTVATNGSPLPYAQIVCMRDDCTNWPGSTFSADCGSNGVYSMNVSAVRRLDLAALAIGYQRQTNSVQPVANAVCDFAMTPGTLRIETETDPQVIYTPHDEGYRPYIRTDAGASGGRYLHLQHNTTWLRNRLYFPYRGDYRVSLRYIMALGGALQVRLDDVVLGSWAPVASWTVSNVLISVSAPGWKTFDIYADGIVKGDPNVGVDYTEISLERAYVTATISGNVMSFVPLQNATISAQLDGGAAMPGATVFTNSNSSGNYTLSATAGESISLSALAVRYRRQTSLVSPVADAVRNFELVRGALVIEPEYDMEVTYQHHSEGYKPSIGFDASCSAEHYLICAHYWTQARLSLYFPKTDQYLFVCRYRTTSCAPELRIDSSTVWSFVNSGGAWLTTNKYITVNAGWRVLDLYGIGFAKAFPGIEGFDYLRIGEDPKGAVIFIK